MNSDKILALWQLFEDYQYSGEKMLKFMKEEKFVKIVSRREVKYAHDYELVEPAYQQEMIVKALLPETVEA